MVGGTTASDCATCELKVMKQKDNSNPKPNCKSKTFLLKGKRDGVWTARWRALPAGCILALCVGLDTAVVVIDRMTRVGKLGWKRRQHWKGSGRKQLHGGKLKIRCALYGFLKTPRLPVIHA
jgi:hypothetical protein